MTQRSITANRLVSRCLRVRSICAGMFTLWNRSAARSFLIVSPRAEGEKRRRHGTSGPSNLLVVVAATRPASPSRWSARRPEGRHGGAAFRRWHLRGVACIPTGVVGQLGSSSERAPATDRRSASSAPRALTWTWPLRAAPQEGIVSVMVAAHEKMFAAPAQISSAARLVSRASAR